MTEERVISEAEADSLPIDVETISTTLGLVEDMSLSTSTREAIDTRTSELIGHLVLLQGQCLGEDQDEDVARLLRIVERHLAPMDRPTSRSPAHEAFHFMHDTAVFVKALLSAYQEKNRNSTS
ncbi:hypothetical protein ACH3X9_31960 [Streptomyces scabiei]